MGNIFKFINDGGTVAWLIVAVGFFAFGLILERFKTLYFDYAIKSESFMAHVKSLILGDKIEEAISFCSAHGKSPMAEVIKGVLERADRDDQALHQALEVKYSEVLPRLSKRFGYLMMIANVATLMGLLGTIHGLMISFEAVSFADPTQRQTILTQGIAMYMSATALGLAVAIPVMFFYSFLHARQTQMSDEIVEYSNKIVDLLTNRHYEVFSKENIYHSSGGDKLAARGKPTTPPPSRKAV